MLTALRTQQGKWTEALENETWFIERDPDNPQLAAKIAVLRLLSGDEEGYRRQCLAMLDRFGGKGVDPTLYTVQSCMTAARPVEVERGWRLIDEQFRLASAKNLKAPHLGYTQLIMAMADYRSGRFARAAELAKGLRGTGRRLEIAAEVLLAMASHRLGDKDLAGQQLTSAAKAVATGLDSHDEWDGHWLDWLTCDALLREAKALIGEGATPPGGPTGLAVAVDYPYVEILLRAGRLDEAIAVFREAATRRPDDARIQKNLGNLLAERGRWEEAAKALDRAAELVPPSDPTWLKATTLRLYLGDDAAHQRLCLAMLARLDETNGVASAYITKSCLISPRPVELGRASRLAKHDFDRARASNPKAEHYGWYQLDWALAEYRKGHFDGAADHLKRCRAGGDVLGLQSESLLAMTYQRLGLKAEASRLLSACRAAIRKAAERPSGWDGQWVDYLTCEMFCREAEALMHDDPARPAGAAPPPAPQAETKR